MFEWLYPLSLWSQQCLSGCIHYKVYDCRCLIAYIYCAVLTTMQQVCVCWHLAAVHCFNTGRSNIDELLVFLGWLRFVLFTCEGHVWHWQVVCGVRSATWSTTQQLYLTNTVAIAEVKRMKHHVSLVRLWIVQPVCTLTCMLVLLLDSTKTHDAYDVNSISYYIVSLKSKVNNYKWEKIQNKCLIWSQDVGRRKFGGCKPVNTIIKIYFKYTLSMCVI